MSQSLQLPAPARKGKTFEEHGIVRQDPYFWLRERENPEVKTYLEEENKFTDKTLQPVTELKEKLYAEIIGRIKKDDDSVPFLWRGYWYFFQYRKGMEYPIYFRRKDGVDKAEMVMDVNQLAKGKEFCDIGEIAYAPNHQLMAFSVDYQGRRQYDVYILDLNNHNISGPLVQNTSGEIEWNAASDHIYYVSIDEETLRPDRIWRASLNKGEKHIEIYFEKDETYHLSISSTKSEKYVLIEANSTLTSETLLIEADGEGLKPEVFLNRKRDHLYWIDHLNDRFYIKTNFKAINFKLSVTGKLGTQPESWEDIQPHNDKVLFEDFELFNDFIAIEERINGLVQIKIRFNREGKTKNLEFNDPAYVVSIGVNPNPESRILRYGYSSMTTPGSMYDYNVDTGNQKLLKQQEVPGGYNPDEYQSERIMATAHDGARVPVSIVYKKGLEKNGKNPVLLYGYGSYGISSDPTFNASRLSLLDRGFVFAIAHIRGGMELGKMWYENGKLLQKKNTFLDFISCTELMINEGFTSSSNMFIMGGSAGGLLMGAVINMRPDLFKGAIAAVPFVDVVTTMMDDSIPLTTLEYDEWGNPNEKAFYKYMLSYSPYDNVKDACFPAILASTGFHDSQVQYWEPAKWVAKLRDHQQCNRPVLLHTNMDAGHGGASGRFARHKETALYYAFFLYCIEYVGE
jgi:oligopeptidase B